MRKHICKLAILFVFYVGDVLADVQSLTFWCGDVCFVRTCENGSCSHDAWYGTCESGHAWKSYQGNIIDMEYLGTNNYVAPQVSSNYWFEWEYLIIGANGDDTIVGWHYPDRICGRGGIDIIKGYQGKDYLNGNQGNDEIRGGKGADCIRGGQGEDWLYGDLNGGMLVGDMGDDYLFGGSGYDFCFESGESMDSCEHSHSSNSDACDHFGISP